MRKPALLAAGFLIALTPAHAANSPDLPRLTGAWSGAQVYLSLTDDGGQLELGCATLLVPGPIRPGATGRFDSRARYETFDGGPTDGDVPPKRSHVYLHGRVDGDTLELSIDRGGTVATEAYTLRRGRRGKIIRCN